MESTTKKSLGDSALRREDRVPPSIPAVTGTSGRKLGRLLSLVTLIVVLAIAAVTWTVWGPSLRHRIAGGAVPASHDHDETADATAHDADDGHDGEGLDAHGESAAEGEAAGHSESSTISLSPQAQKNIGLTLFEVARRDFQRTVTVPAVMVERPGRSEIAVSAPMTGIVTRIHPLLGEAVAPGDPLFDLRLTHEDLVEKQSDLLRDLETLDVVEQEVRRLEEVARTGAVAGKRLLEQVYEKQKVEGAIRAEREALLLHGLREEQIATIEKERRLVKSIVVYAPEPEESHAAGEHGDLLQVAKLSVNRGDHVVTGAPLLTLTDHCELYIEGRAFEQDAESLNRAANLGTPVVALVEASGGKKEEIADLKILYIENQVDRESRALKFYIGLPNQLLRDEKAADGHRFIAWRYRPGQRVEVLLPVEQWSDRLVLPVQAIIQEGANCYVYRAEGDHFDQQGIHVEYRDQQWAVIGNDEVLAPGDMVANAGAYQIHLALKNKSGGGMDPHAGHNH